MVILYQFVGVVGTAIIVVGIACGSNSLKFDIRPVVGITMFSFYYGAPCNKSLQCGNIMARKQIALNIFFFHRFGYYSMCAHLYRHDTQIAVESLRACLYFHFVPLLILFPYIFFSLRNIISNDYYYIFFVIAKKYCDFV